MTRNHTPFGRSAPHRAPPVARSLPILLVLVLGFAGCASHPRGLAVAPGRAFAGELIEARAPQTDGWLLVQSSASAFVFAKDGDVQGSSFVATASTFPLAPPKTPAEFEALIKEALAKDTDPVRFDIQQASVAYSSERSYPCVRYNSLTLDRNPVGSSAPLLLALDGLYCRHPVRQDVGFAAVFSYRGASRHPTLRSEAEAFIQGVRAREK